MRTFSSSYDAWIDAYGCLLSFDKQTWAFFCNFEFPGIHFIFCGFHPKMEVNQLFNRNINYAKCLTMKGNAFLNMFYKKSIQLCFQKKWKIKLSEIQEISPKWLDLTQKTNICQNNLTYLIFNTCSNKNWQIEAIFVTKVL